MLGDLEKVVLCPYVLFKVVVDRVGTAKGRGGVGEGVGEGEGDGRQKRRQEESQHAWASCEPRKL